MESFNYWWNKGLRGNLFGTAFGPGDFCETLDLSSLDRVPVADFHGRNPVSSD
jgi:hypothetical protein